VILRNRSIAALLTAEVLSSLGSRMTWLALPWFVLVTTGSPTRMGIVFAIEVVPMALFGIPGVRGRRERAHGGDAALHRHASACRSSGLEAA